MRTSASAAAAAEVARFRAAIVQHIGLQFDDAKLPFLDAVLRRRLNRASCPGAIYLDGLEARPSRGELQVLAQQLTVGETYFFRHNDQFRALAEVALPDRMSARAESRSLHVLSAGCSSGEEPYSLAIVTREVVADRTWDILIRAFDLNPLALDKAARGRYSAWALREAPAEVRQRWFRGDDRELTLDESVRGAVRFAAGNLAADDPELWPAAAYDVIFCRNVLMYFAPEQMRAAIARMAAALAPGGYLFLGHAETLRGISDGFDLCCSHGTFYYKRKAPGGAARRNQRQDRVGADTDRRPTPDAVSWTVAIRQASERVAALTATPSSSPAPSPPTGRPPWRLAPVFDLLRHERYAEALDHVRAGSPEADADPDVLLVKSVLLAQHGDLPAAAETCRRLLAINQANAGAHYVLALCHEQAGGCSDAIAQDHIAASLDPTFAMPRLHSGLLARRCGDRDTARRELGQALLLLRREDVSRLLLFGGGFSRAALIALCQSAAAECGVAS